MIRVLGLDLLDVELTTAEDEDAAEDKTGPGDCTTERVPFSAGYGDQRWTETPPAELS